MAIVRRDATCPTFVGREPELAQVRDAFARTPGVVFVCGEAGVGKSRLLAEAVRTAPDTVTVLRASCLPGGHRIPYAPIVHALRTAPAAQRDQHLDDTIAALVAVDADGRGPAGERSTLGRTRLFTVVTAQFERLAAKRPVVLIVEDLHWCDASTLHLLDFVVRGGNGAPILLAGSYRDDDVPADHPLPATLAELRRLPPPMRARTVRLSRFNADESRQFIAGILDEEPAPELAARIFTRSQGNAFLAEELLASCATDGSGELPASTREILLAGCRGLSGPAQQVVLAVAVAGRSLGHAVLARMTSTTEDDLLASIRETVDRRILQPVGDGYDFRHALVAEAVLAEALPGELVRLHRAIADALEARTEQHSPAYWAKLSRHRIAANQPEPALVASVRAGLAAEHVFAMAEASLHFESAIDAWPDAPGAHSDAALDLTDLYLHAAEAAYLVGAGERAAALIRRGIDSTTDPLRKGVLQERYSRYMVVALVPEPHVIDAYQEAVDLVPAAPSRERARVLAGLAASLMLGYRQKEAFQVCDRALAVARQVGARDEEGRVLATMGMGMVMTGEIAEGVRLMRQALAIATDAGHTEEMLRGYGNLSDSLRAAGQYAESARVALEGMASAVRRGADGVFAGLLLGNAIDALFLQGRWSEIDRLLVDGPPATYTDPYALGFAAGVARLSTARGRFDEAETYLTPVAQALAQGGNSTIRVLAGVELATHELWRGHPARALQHVDAVTDVLERGDYDSTGVHLLAVALRAVAALGPDGRKRYATQRYSALIAGAPDYAHRVPEAAAYLALAEAELTRARGASDPAAWAQVADNWARLECPYHRAYALWRAGQALLASAGGRRDAADRLSVAAAISADLGAQPLRDGIHATTRDSSLDPAKDRDSTGLTRRETEVWRELAAGRTNREIARALFLSESTVSIHVSRILAKLGVTNRSAAAVIAHRRGLFTESANEQETA
jgi:DNA-binding CsgD family transcriptional regulator/tetratricopeptide (TPR) repeat protein